MFFKRLCSSVILVIATLATVLSGGAILAGALLILSVIAFFELMKACGVHNPHRKVNALEAAGLIGIAGYYLATFFSDSQAVLCAVVVLTFLLIMFVYVFAFPKFRSSQVMTTFFCVFYAPVLLSFLYLTRSLPNGSYLVWLIFISSWICDTFAYLTGMLLGRHRLAPKLSPKKSVEGAVGGVLGSALVGALYGYLIVERAIPGEEITWSLCLLGAAGAVISQVGDLAASAIKRNFDIKDYGKLIPGHGGIMDRFDSVIFTAPVIYFLALFLIA